MLCFSCSKATYLFRWRHKFHQISSHPLPYSQSSSQSTAVHTGTSNDETKDRYGERVWSPSSLPSYKLGNQSPERPYDSLRSHSRSVAERLEPIPHYARHRDKRNRLTHSSHKLPRTHRTHALCPPTCMTVYYRPPPSKTSGPKHRGMEAVRPLGGLKERSQKQKQGNRWRETLPTP